MGGGGRRSVFCGAHDGDDDDDEDDDDGDTDDDSHLWGGVSVAERRERGQADAPSCPSTWRRVNGCERGGARAEQETYHMF